MKVLVFIGQAIVTCICMFLILVGLSSCFTFFLR